MLFWVSFGANAMIGVYNLDGRHRLGAASMMIGLELPPIVMIFIMMAILIVLGTA